MSDVSVRDLLEAGVHFGHQTARWNPKMKNYIFGARNGIHILDLQKSLPLFKECNELCDSAVARGESVLFVGTKNKPKKSSKSKHRDVECFT